VGPVARYLLFAAVFLVTAVTTARAAAQPCDSWPMWQRFRQLYVSDDGRVVDASTPRQVTVSEGQAYALIFALIGNDPETFAKTLRWTENNLARGDLTTTLPAWQWGRAADDTWTVLDTNSAADADLWIAYALSEAGRLWQRPSYAKLGRAVSEQILGQEVALVPGLGPAVMPAPKGFVADQVWRLNASYLPIEVLRVVGRQGANPLWAGVLNSAAQVIEASAPRGFAADWIGYREAQGFVTDSATAGIGSYDAIRVYLWAGMLDDRDALAERLRRILAPMELFAAGHAAPEIVDTATLAVRGEGPVGFSAALLPLLARAKHAGALRTYRERAVADSLKDSRHYYSDALSLFGLGWLDGRFKFDRRGNLEPLWTTPCLAP
jgi:endoglucanase